MTDQKDQSGQLQAQVAALQAERDELKHTIDAIMPEAGGICFTEVWEYVYPKTDDPGAEPKYIRFNVTQRHAASGTEALKKLRQELTAYLESEEGSNLSMYPFFATKLPDRQVEQTEQAPAQAARKAGFGGRQATSQQAPAQAPAQQQQATGETVLRQGSNILKTLTIRPDKGKQLIEFQLDGLDWPLKDYRGFGIVEKLFTPEVELPEGFLAENGVYTQQDFGVLKVDWVCKQVTKGDKPVKYYDVVKVYPG